jgi:diguanylate cyclase (GGDEF)-like protein
MAAALEGASLAVFISVYTLYPTPDFSIQVLGMMVIIMLIYLTPGRWIYMNIVAAAGIAGFMACTMGLVPQVDGGHLAAGLVYLGVIAVLCAIVALQVRAYQYREYVSREDLKRDYATDMLTGLGNRIRLEEETAKWLDRMEKYGMDLSLVVMDVDNMKKVNDTFGHVQGDLVLCQLAEVMRAELRRDDVCVRWGGDEFILLLPYTKTNDAEKLMRRMQRAISGHAFDPPVTLTCSFGIAPMKLGVSLTAMLAQADALMYDAKRQGKNARKAEENADTVQVC